MTLQLPIVFICSDGIPALLWLFYFIDTVSRYTIQCIIQSLSFCVHFEFLVWNFYNVVFTVESKLTDLPTILDLLTIDNLKMLCKNLKVIYNSSKQKTVEALIKHSNSYRPIFGSKSAGSVVITKWVSFMAYSWDNVVNHKPLCESIRISSFQEA